jgi:hypothetical protein
MRSVFRLATFVLCAFFLAGCVSVTGFNPDRTTLEQMMYGIVRISHQSSDRSSNRETDAATGFIIAKGDRCILVILLKNPLAFEFESEEAIFC